MSVARGSLVALLVVCLAVFSAGCSGTGTTVETSELPTAEPITIGTKNFTEQHILGELYRQALAAEGFPVELKSNIGSSEIIHRALTGGGIDMYPEYIGVLLSEVADNHRRPRDAQAAYEVAKRFEERQGFTLLAMTPFTDSNAIAVEPETARRHGVSSIGDLARIPGRATIGAPPEFQSRFEGSAGLREVYGLTDITVRPLRIGRQYEALEAGRVDAAAVFTTDGQLAQRRFRVLDDPRGLFASQHVAPVIDRTVLERHGSRSRRRSTRSAAGSRRRR